MHEILCVNFKEDTAKECAVIQKDRSLWDDVMWTNEMTSLEETCHHTPPGGISPGSTPGSDSSGIGSES